MNTNQRHYSPSPANFCETKASEIQKGTVKKVMYPLRYFCALIKNTVSVTYILTINVGRFNFKKSSFSGGNIYISWWHTHWNKFQNVKYLRCHHPHIWFRYITMSSSLRLIQIYYDVIIPTSDSNILTLPRIRHSMTLYGSLTLR